MCALRWRASGRRGHLLGTAVASNLSIMTDPVPIRQLVR